MADEPIVARGWEVTGAFCADEFFSALPELLPLPVTLYFECTGIDSNVRSLLSAHEVPAGMKIPRGTIWPKPTKFHVRATESFLRELSKLAARRAEPEICDHLHAYSQGRGLLQWFDAFSGDPLLVDETIAESSVREFCQELGAQYVRWNG